MIIDFHNHIYPERYLAYLAALDLDRGGLGIVRDDLGRQVIVDRGARVATVMPGHTDLALRLADMDRTGIDVQVISLTAPMTDCLEDRGAALELAQVANDEIADYVARAQGRLVGLATLPLRDPPAAVRELERAVTRLGLRGAMIASNVNGLPLNRKEFWPVYEAAAALDVPVMIHPTTPAGSEVMYEYRLAPLVGFEFDLALAVTRLAFSGLFEALPTFTLTVSHLGGGLPFLAERIDSGFRAYPECRQDIARPPSEYFRRIYFDTVSFYQPALACTYALAGPEHMLLGSDYPHVIGDLERAAPSVREMPIPEEEKRKILGENARRLLKL